MNCRTGSSGQYASIADCRGDVMSINRDMKKYMLQKNVPTKSPSGAIKDVWTDVQEVDVAVYKTDELKVVASEKYTQSTHTGLTRYKDITADNRLKKGDTIYEITSCNTEGRLTNLLLKVVV